MSLATADNDSENDPVPTNRVYEIAMVAVAGGIMLMCGLIFIVLVLKRRWSAGGVAYNNYTEESTVSNINLNRTTNDKISTADHQGPAYINYINEKGKPPTEIPIGNVKLSRDALLYISLITCMNLPDDIGAEENL
ncbi:uncharacterized protein LOC143804811 [Ranitomeya variabilis]|uniref:uncharacterized protein LOC143804811 n=1 Tax=Ranitomeya variabilis TaxID=490064 RepID=UPI004055BC4C